MTTKRANPGYIAGFNFINSFDRQLRSSYFDSFSRSTFNNPELALVRNVCDSVAWMRGAGTVTLLELVDCEPVLAGTASIKVLVPVIGNDGVPTDGATVRADAQRIISAVATRIIDDMSLYQDNTSVFPAPTTPTSGTWV